MSRTDIDYNRIVAPTLVAPETGRQLASKIKGSKFVTIQTAGHFPYIQTPEECADVIGEFLTADL